MDAEVIKGFVEEIMDISEWGKTHNILLFRGKLYGSAEATMTRLREKLSPFNFIPLISKGKEGVILKIGFLPEKKKPKKPTIHIVLFALTVLSTLYAGAYYVTDNFLINPSDLLKGIPFSLSILLILGSHELGHFFTSQHAGVDASLPYFIPFPHLFGTLGAFIKIRSPIPDKKSLMKIGAAGPLAGLAFAIPILIIGFKLSQVVSLSELEELKKMPDLAVGPSILFYLMLRFSIDLPQGYTVLLHPLAFAGWAGIFVTGLNLLPAGQLDGGHISYAVFGRYHKWVARGVFFVLLPLGILWPGWWIIAGLLFFLIGLRHPPPLDDITPLGSSEKFIGWLAIGLFVLTFTPIPVIVLP